MALLTVLALPGLAQQQPRLAIQGAPHFDGDLVLTVTDPTGAGEIVWLALGLDPLPLRELLPTGIGPWGIGQLLEVLPLAFMPAGGRLDVPFNLGPVVPGAIGAHLVIHGYVDPWLTNPATIPLDEPYFTPGDAVTITSPQPTTGATFGEKVEIGDLNGDGHPDLVVGAWFEQVSGILFAGRAYVFWGPDFTSSVTLTSPNPVERGYLGERLGLADIDGDGQVDLVLPEAPGAAPLSPTAHGHLYVYWGGRTFSATPGLTVESAGSGPTYEAFGRWLAVGDYDGDGAADVAAGVVLAAVGGLTNAGKIELYWGPDLQTTTEVLDPEPAQNTWFGDHPATGDVTGDGVDDLLVGCPRKTVGGTVNVGRAYVFSGGRTLGLAQIIENPLPAGVNSRFGNWIDAADFDGDGAAELVTTDQRDHAYIFWSPTLTEHTVIDRPPAWFVQPENSISYGYVVAAGDVNGDGFVDVAVGDPFGGPMTSCSFGFSGAVLVALGPYYATHHTLVDLTPECLTEFGWSIAIGDLDGDQLSEIVVGNDLADASGLNGSGKVILFRRP